MKEQYECEAMPTEADLLYDLVLRKIK